MKRHLITMASLLVMLAIQGCMHVVLYDGTYRGKVIDAETREPIEGVVVLGTWLTESPTVAGAHTDYYDARETVTSKDGEFSIPGQGLRIMSRLLPMSVTIFKSGYQYFGSVAWDSLKPVFVSEVKWENDRAIFNLRKITLEERNKQGSPPSPPDDAPFDSVKKYLREIDKDRLDRGLDARGLWRGTKYE